MGLSGIYRLKQLVRKGRFELPRVTPLAPKTSASTSSATFASPPGGGDNSAQAQSWWAVQGSNLRPAD